MHRSVIANKDFLMTVTSGTDVYAAKVTIHKSQYGLGAIVLHCQDGTKLGVCVNQYDLVRIAREALECSALSDEEEPAPWDDDDFADPDGPIFERRKSAAAAMGGESYDFSRPTWVPLDDEVNG